jgi:hypothetical protein
LQPVLTRNLADGQISKARDRHFGEFLVDLGNQCP